MILTVYVVSLSKNQRNSPIVVRNEFKSNKHFDACIACFGTISVIDFLDLNEVAFEFS